MYQFVMRLRQDFENNRTQLLGRPTPPSLDEALASLIAEETRLSSLASAPMTHTSVLAAPRGPFRGPSSGKFCSHCKRIGHTIDSCFALHPELWAEYQRNFPAQQQQRHPSSRKSSAVAISEPQQSQQPARSASVSAASQSASRATQPWVLDSGDRKSVV